MGAADEEDEQQSIFSFHLLEPDEYRRLRKKIRLTPGVLLLAGIFLALIISIGVCLHKIGSLESSIRNDLGSVKGRMSRKFEHLEGLVTGIEGELLRPWYDIYCTYSMKYWTGQQVKQCLVPVIETSKRRSKLSKKKHKTNISEILSQRRIK